MEITPRRAIIALAIINFIVAVQGGLTVYLDSKYLKMSLGAFTPNTDVAVSIVYALTAAISLVELIFMSRLLRKFGARNIALFGAVTQVMGLAILALNPSPIWIVVAYPIFTVIPLLVSLDILAEAYIDEEHVARIRSYIYASGSFGMLLGPAPAGWIAEHYGIQTVYTIAALIILPIIALFAWCFRNHKDATYEDTPLFIAPSDKKITPDLMPIFWTQIMIQSFYMLMVIYIPLIMQDIGVTHENFGVMMTIALFAFVVVPGPLGYFADKYIGEKEFIVAGLSLMGLSLIAIPLLIPYHPSVLVWGLVLFVSRVGAAGAESMADAFFFKKYQREHPALVVYYRRARPIAQLAFPMVAGIMLEFKILTMSQLLLVFGFVLIAATALPMQIRDTK